MINLEPPHHAKILIALGLNRKAVVIATDSDWVERELDDVNNDCEDLGMLSRDDWDLAPGIYLWEGTMKCEFRGAPWDGQEWETIYKGTLRPIVSELDYFLKMEPQHQEPIEIIPTELYESDADE